MKKPYVGVSGVVSREQADDTYYAAERSKLMPERRLMLGVKAVHTTLMLEKVDEEHGRNWYPVGPDFREVSDSIPYPDEFWVAQVMMDKDSSANDSEYQKKFLRKLLYYTKDWVNGVQLELPTCQGEDYMELIDFMKAIKWNLEIILQCSDPTIQEETPRHIADKLDTYRGHVDHVLFDISAAEYEGGLDSLRPYIAEVLDRGWLGVGVAGGLDAARVDSELAPILEEFPVLNFDAEDRLHMQEGSSKALNMRQVEAYLSAAASAIKRVNK